MKMKIKRLLVSVLAVATILGMISPGFSARAVNTDADVNSDIQSAINSGDTIFVTGSKYDTTATLELDIPNGVVVNWSAVLSGKINATGANISSYILKIRLQSQRLYI